MPKEIKPSYVPKTLPAKMGYVVEEFGEVLAAIGKTQRHGLDSFNPEVPQIERETNAQWVLRELVDARRAIALLETALTEHLDSQG